VYKNAERRPIQITLKDGKVMEGTSYETTPGEIAKKISKPLFLNAIVA
jgi:threonyl-tRNA synthetase